MRILANADNNTWKHHAGTIHVLQKTERGVVGIQECEDHGRYRRDIVFVQGLQNGPRIVRRGILGGYSEGGDTFQPLVFWTNQADDAIVSVQTLSDARYSFRSRKITPEIIDLALATFEDFLRELSASVTR